MLLSNFKQQYFSADVFHSNKGKSPIGSIFVTSGKDM